MTILCIFLLQIFSQIVFFALRCHQCCQAASGHCEYNVLDFYFEKFDFKSGCV